MTARAVVLLLMASATLFAAFNVGVGWLYALGFLFSSYMVSAFTLATRTLVGLRVTAYPAASTSVGEALPCMVTLESSRRKRSFISLLAPPLGASEHLRALRGPLVPDGWGHALVVEAAAGQRTLVTLGVPSLRRGVFHLGPLVVQSPALGLGAVHRTIPLARTVIVRPRVHALPELSWLRSTFDPSATEALGMRNVGFELIKTVREYRSGDPMRSIHWRSTAKAGELRVKETEGGSEVPGRLAIVLDLGADHTPATFEHAITLAASLCAHAHGLGLSPHLSAQVGTPKAQDLDSQLDWLAGLEPFSAPLAMPQGEGHALVITASRTSFVGASLGLYVGEGQAPKGAIACSPGPDWEARLGGALGA